ncbi:unnamed protein product [Linum trigynum]|uniref:Uncharacterized protein n=1 Tax=Linum trigynum TaxID=586398 RepID=A0AAV2G3F4_9ROSI
MEFATQMLRYKLPSTLLSRGYFYGFTSTLNLEIIYLISFSCLNDYIGLKLICSYYCFVLIERGNVT